MVDISLNKALLTRLLRYTQIHTTSDASSQTVPSTPQQWDLLNLLKDEMRALGLSDITLDENGYLFATIPATVNKPVPVLGLLANYDIPLDAESYVHRIGRTGRALLHPRCVPP